MPSDSVLFVVFIMFALPRRGGVARSFLWTIEWRCDIFVLSCRGVIPDG